MIQGLSLIIILYSTNKIVIERKFIHIVFYVLGYLALIDSCLLSADMSGRRHQKFFRKVQTNFSNFIQIKVGCYFISLHYTKICRKPFYKLLRNLFFEIFYIYSFIHRKRTDTTLERFIKNKKYF